MPAPTNTTPGTATVIPSLPYSVSQTVDFGGTTYEVWYKYIAQPSDVVIGVWGLGSADLTTYIPTTVTFSPDGTTSYLGGVGGQNKPFQIPVADGVAYYFRVRSNAGNPSPAVLSLSVLAHSAQTVPVGSIAINDDTELFPLALLDASADNTVLAFQRDIAAGEGGDILPNGLLLLENNSASDLLTLYDSNYNVIANVTTLNVNVVSTNKADTFYIGNTTTGVTPATVTTVSSAGVLGPTEWTLTGTINLQGLAPSPDETILYYFKGGGSDLPIKRWDLVGNVALSDLVSGVGAGFALQKDLLCLDDGSVIVMVRSTGTTTQECRRYSAAGALLNTYTLTYSLSSTGGDRLAYGVDDTTFWVQQKGNPQRIGTVSQIRVSDGTVLTTRAYRYYETGVYQGVATLTPDARFGPSFSCPFWITRTGLVPPPPTNLNGPAALEYFAGQGQIVTYPILRVRRFPHLSDERQRIFIQRLQIIAEVGIGSAGTNPTVELRVSKDGGWTFGNWRDMSVGKLGQYLHRCYAVQLGMARDWVFEIRTSDPFFTSWLSAVLNLEEGLL